MTSDVPTEASIDISIRWKFPYHPPEPELELAITEVLSQHFLINIKKKNRKNWNLIAKILENY